MSGFDFTKQGLHIQPRDPARSPKNPQCPWHLRRVCGTCAYFIPDDPANRRDLGDCSKFKGAVEGRFSAAACTAWTRPHGEPSAKGGKR